jgi:hypothetical protein
MEHGIPATLAFNAQDDDSSPNLTSGTEGAVLEQMPTIISAALSEEMLASEAKSGLRREEVQTVVTVIAFHKAPSVDIDNHTCRSVVAA